MDGLVSFLIGFLSIALMVTIHETGHFVFARLSGITVEVFAIGWGKAIKRWTVRGVEYRINIFPLGGYCKLKGTDDLQRSLHSGGKSFTSMEEGSLFAVSPIRRIMTYLGGPLFNLLFAIVIFIPFFSIGYDAISNPNRIVVTSDYPKTFAIEAGSPHAAEFAGLETGDVVIGIENESIGNFSSLQAVLARQKAGNPTTFTIDRAGDILTIDVTGTVDEKTDRLLFGISTFIEPKIDSISPLSPESMTALAEGDVIIRAQGHEVKNTFDLLEILSDNPSWVELQVQHADGSYDTIQYSPTRTIEGKISFGFNFERTLEHVSGQPVGEALWSAISQTGTSMIDTFLLIPKLFSGAFAMDEVVAGPLRISYVIGEMRNAGIRAILHLLAMVSISLAAANLLPIPGLDGGSILLSLVEILRRKAVSPRMYVRFQSVGLLFLFLLMLFVVAGDLRFFFLGS
ncbi:MAG: RIP metalloprotease RseP [Sphaerochaeta sp.]|jgi:regulator of sigma E protease|nr:RIP metalloprotease RseP [Sphaerochaeta sp.]PKL29636.1 MAG: RIP metalloprotease RseP [Spirochaetae bacterium HGW-Spirochaetae-2]